VWRRGRSPPLCGVWGGCPPALPGRVEEQTCISPLRALAFDVERNLRGPVIGIARTAELRGIAFHRPEIALRTGDTPAAERARMARHPPDILITTPESLFLVLTSRARAMLSAVELVIVDEIHALAGTKRGAHLALSLDMLSGRYPSDEFAELRPRLVWDRLRGIVRAREGAARLAIANAGTIPDRGLYGVFLADGGEGAPDGRGGAEPP
jgi:Lhr-like helicase